jgi:hypothetical protein
VTSRARTGRHRTLSKRAGVLAVPPGLRCGTMEWFSKSLNPRQRYPRRYERGHFLALSKRYEKYTAHDSPSIARALFTMVFANKQLQSWFKSIFRHGLFAILVAAGIAITGHSYMVLRSFGIILCAVWIILELGVWLSKKTWSLQRKAIIFSIGFCASCCFAMMVMYSFLDNTLADERTSVWQNLTPEHHTLGNADEPLDEMFTVRNNSEEEISGKNQISCAIHFLSEYDGSMIFSHITMGFENGMWVLSGTDDPTVLKHIPTGLPLNPGGDAQTTPCLSGIRLRGFKGASCVDMTLVFWYSLENQADVEQEKHFHFVGYRQVGRAVSWSQEPENSREDYCANFSKIPTTY